MEEQGSRACQGFRQGFPVLLKGSDRMSPEGAAGLRSAPLGHPQRHFASACSHSIAKLKTSLRPLGCRVPVASSMEALQYGPEATAHPQVC